MEMTEVKDLETSDTESSVEDWVKEVYSDVDEQLLKSWYEEFRYQGFDRDSVLKGMHDKLRDKSISQKMILICALRGPVGASKGTLNGRPVLSYGIPLRSGKGMKGVSINRVTAATADYAAFLLKKLKIPKRINCECPGWLQFPSAASIRMPERYRKMHKEFALLFSERINLDGKHGFNEDIYTQMELNSYLEETLNLFSEN